MKKIILAMSFVLGTAMSFSTFAATTFIGTDEVTGTSTGECTLLAETVNLSVSANVVGGWACDETLNIIQVAACHPGGSRDQGPQCTEQTPDDTSDDPNLPAGCDTAEGYSTIPDYKAFMASSAGGVMTEKALGTRCTESSLGGLSDWKN